MGATQADRFGFGLQTLHSLVEPVETRLSIYTYKTQKSIKEHLTPQLSSPSRLLNHTTFKHKGQLVFITLSRLPSPRTHFDINKLKAAIIGYNYSCYYQLLGRQRQRTFYTRDRISGVVFD